LEVPDKISSETLNKENLNNGNAMTTIKNDLSEKQVYFSIFITVTGQGCQQIRRHRIGFRNKKK
jgi:hypothetical protein